MAGLAHRPFLGDTPLTRSRAGRRSDGSTTGRRRASVRPSAYAEGHDGRLVRPWWDSVRVGTVQASSPLRLPRLTRTGMAFCILGREL
jgi:hypothetical protein